MRLTKRQVLSAAAGALFAPSFAEAAIEERKMKAYSIYCNADPEMQVLKEILDGNWWEASAEGFEFKSPTYSVRVDAGYRIDKGEKNHGFRIDPTHLPTRIKWGGRHRKLDDVQYTANTFIVSEKFRQVVEQLEPGKHQFEPVALEWADGSAASDQQYYWFFVLARLDTFDREHSTHEWNGRRWKRQSKGRFSVSFERTKGNAIWQDMYIGSTDNPIITGQLKQAMDDAGITGIGYHEMAVV